MCYAAARAAGLCLAGCASSNRVTSPGRSWQPRHFHRSKSGNFAMHRDLAHLVAKELCRLRGHFVAPRQIILTHDNRSCGHVLRAGTANRRNLFFHVGDVTIGELDARQNLIGWGADAPAWRRRASLQPSNTTSTRATATVHSRSKLRPSSLRRATVGRLSACRVGNGKTGHAPR